MEQLRDFSDERLIVGCIYCGGLAETREHVPSRVFLDAPLPGSLPVVGACRACNNGFSLDEEYLACLVESVIVGSAEPRDMRRPGIASILRRAPALQARLAAARSWVPDRVEFAIEPVRIKNVLVKLARGHAAFELGQPCKGEPASTWWGSLGSMDDDRRSEFESSHIAGLFGEVGSRGMQRMMVAELTLRSGSAGIENLALLVIDWVDVQEGRYRYHAIDDEELIRIKLVIGEYLACEVAWER